jgi:endoglucanase
LRFNPAFFLPSFSLPSFFLVVPVSLVAACSGLFPGGGGGNPAGDVPPPTWVTHDIRVDTVGYVTGRVKAATVVLPAGMTALSDTTAEVFDLNGNLQWACTVTGPFSDTGLNVTYYLADFTPFDDPGTFYVEVPALGSDGTAQSAPFQIAPDVFAGALTTAMTGLYGQRCGTAVKITMGHDTWQHGACHQHDADSLQYLTGAQTPFPSVGGWHDAGDYGKYVNNGAFSVGMLLAAWEHFQPTLAGLTLPIPEHGKTAAGGSAPLPDFLWEVKWELDWLLTAQSASGGSGGLPDKLTALAFENYGTMPDIDGQKRYFSGIGTAMTADFVAVMAEAARIYQEDAPTDAANYLAAAQLGYQYLTANAGPAVADNDNPSMKTVNVFSTGHYSESDPDNRLWAAAELWETTGDAAALADFETRAAAPGQTVAADFDWSNVANLGYYTYLLSQRADAGARDATLVSALSASLTTAADSLVTTAGAHVFGRALGDNFYWGSNGSVARSAMLLWVANTLSPDPKYLDTIEMQVDFLLGRNSYDRSQVTMVGYHPPLSPHHGPSSGDGVPDPWPGLLVGGANNTATLEPPSDYDWTDNAADYDVNEIAINWITPFVYATAALTPPAM